MAKKPVSGQGDDAPHLSVDAVEKHFGGVIAVDNISIAVRRGEIRSIIGPNGAGKTSLLNTISGFYRPDRARSGSRVGTSPMPARRKSPSAELPEPSRTSRCSLA